MSDAPKRLVPESFCVNWEEDKGTAELYVNSRRGRAILASPDGNSLSVDAHCLYEALKEYYGD